VETQEQVDFLRAHACDEVRVTTSADRHRPKSLFR
jgi:hypothetical protein